jgi:3-oxoacyl-[acyl-carrier-protein] synthase-3
MEPVRILGTGSFVPPRVLSNFDLEKMGLDTTDEWIVQRTGIRERRIADPEVTTSDLGYEAALKALDVAGLSAKDLDLIIMATITPDTCCPAAANWLQAKLNAPQAVTFDITAACSGFVFALDAASRYIQAGAARKVLAVASEVMTRTLDWSDRSTCILWGDGAGAAVLTAEDRTPALLASTLGSDGAGGANLLMPGGGSATTPISHQSVEEKRHTLKMIDAAASVKTAVKHFAQAVHDVLDPLGLSVRDVRHFIPHQANLRILRSAAKRLDVDFDRFVITLDKYGNISSASCAIALDEAVRSGRIQPGDLVCFTVFGGGLTWGSALIQF